jgi:hypothetical protein
MFMAAELLGAAVAAALFTWLMPARNARAVARDAKLSEST